MSSAGPIFILSIDGGGARGAIPATLLCYLEAQHDVSIRDDFDFFAGVSTGALVAAYIARDAGSLEHLAHTSYSAEVLSDIFDKSVWDKMLGRMQNQPKYDGRGKREYIEGLMGDLRINDIRDKHLLILAYDFINRELVTFKNNRGHDATYNPTLAEVCDAASAAPTLYPPVATSAPRRTWLIDGALATNDPSHCAISEALAMGYTLEDVWMVSIATGAPVHDLSHQQRDRIGRASTGWGIFGWIRNGLFDHMMTASSTVSAHHCRQLLGDRYLRIRGELPRKLMQLDNTSPAGIEDLKSYAFRWYEEHLEAFLRLLDAVRKERSAHQKRRVTPPGQALVATNPSQ
jgi:patatin-like phospholipase/acyl hydrolase